jgi:hypothetical protein
MDSNIILSEVNPHGEVVGIKDQAIHWFDLIEKSHYQLFENLTYCQQILYLLDITQQKGLHLIIRDWTVINFIDSIGCPNYLTFASGELEQEVYLTRENLKLTSVAFVRKSASVYSSILKTFPHLQSWLTLDIFASSYLKFAQKICNYPIFKYEEFCKNPTICSKSLCKYLNIKYDASFLNNFYNYNLCSGDNSLESRGSSLNTISVLPNDDSIDSLYTQASLNVKCQEADKILGY